eukprot:jgi/Mesvir1/15520/Mv03172-RA.1
MRYSLSPVTIRAGNRRLSASPRAPLPARPSTLCSAASDGSQASTGGGGAVAAPASTELDTELLIKYIGATTLQYGLLIASLYGLDALLRSKVGLLATDPYPAALVFLYFGFMAVRSRVFSILDASRNRTDPDRNDFKRPSWMPPRYVFPIVWTIIPILRASSSVILWEACGRNLLVAPLAALLGHLAIGDLWNTAFGDQRRGAAVPLVFGVLMSVYYTTYLFWSVSPKAGMVLAPSCVWLTVATILVTTIWQINGSEPLYPIKRN